MQLCAFTAFYLLHTFVIPYFVTNFLHFRFLWQCVNITGISLFSCQNHASVDRNSVTQYNLSVFALANYSHFDYTHWTYLKDYGSLHFFMVEPFTRYLHWLDGKESSNVLLIILTFGSHYTHSLCKTLKRWKDYYGGSPGIFPPSLSLPLSPEFHVMSKLNKTSQFHKITPPLAYKNILHKM